MAYSIAWNEAFPAGTDAANQIHIYIQNKQIAIRERLDDIFGTTGVTSIDTADPYLPSLLKLSGAAASKIIPGATSFSIRNNANNRDNVLVDDDGDVVIYKDLRVDSGQAYTDRYDAGSSGAAKTLDFANGNTQLLLLTANTTLTLSNPKSGAFYTFEFKQDGTGGRTITWPANVKWASDTLPSISSTAGLTSIVCVYYNGTNYAATLVGVNFNV